MGQPHPLIPRSVFQFLPGILPSVPSPRRVQQRAAVLYRRWWSEYHPRQCHATRLVTVLAQIVLTVPLELWRPSTVGHAAIRYQMYFLVLVYLLLFFYPNPSSHARALPILGAYDSPTSSKVANAPSINHVLGRSRETTQTAEGL